MAEKNTLSILETIKKKMLKIDQKSEQPVKVSEGNEEFQYISSGAPKVAAAPVEIKAPAPVAPKFEDNLGLDLEAKPAPAKASGMGSFDDFNLDDLDLDEEEKTFTASVKSAPSFTAKAAPQEVKDEIEEEDLEEFEDDVDFEVEEELVEEELVEEEAETLETPEVISDTGPVDWLGNPTNSSVETDELNLDVGAGIEEKVEGVESEDELEEDLENSEEELDLEESEDELEEESEEELEEQGEEESGEETEEELEEESEDESEEDLENGEEELDLEGSQDELEDESEDEQLDEKESAEDGLESWEEEEEVVKNAAQATLKMPSEGGLDFSDLEREDDFLETSKVEKELSSFENLAKPVEVEKTQQPATFETREDLIKKAEPVVEKHEVDLEFEKELMGFRADASETIPAPKIPPINQMSVQNNVSVMAQQPSEIKAAAVSPYDTTVRQVGDSVKKLLDAKNVVAGISSFSQSPALAELALHLMEPKIEKWFNDNLPELVEKIVREEIRKMIPKE